MKNMFVVLYLTSISLAVFAKPYEEGKPTSIQTKVYYGIGFSQGYSSRDAEELQGCERGTNDAARIAFKQASDDAVTKCNQDSTQFKSPTKIGLSHCAPIDWEYHIVGNGDVAHHAYVCGANVAAVGFDQGFFGDN